MINPQWLELPMSRTNLHGRKEIRDIEVRLYILKNMIVDQNLCCSFADNFRASKFFLFTRLYMAI